MRKGQDIHDKKLWVCWVKPTCLPSENIRILSFLRPSDEENFIQSIPKKNHISGRIVAQEIQDNALELYTELVARIGAEKNGKSSSLRALLKPQGGNSLWWYHPVSFKDCEADPTFNSLIQILLIDRIASEENIKKIVLWGADDTIASVLKNKYRIEYKKKKHRSIVLRYIWVLGSRVKQFIEHVYNWYLIKHGVKEISFIPDVMFEGFWDWSVEPGTKEDSLYDRYFKSLPDLLEQQGKKTAWLLWFNPQSAPGLICRSAKEVLNRAISYERLIFLQKYLTLKDIIKAFSNFKPAIKYMSFERSLDFRKLFDHNGLNLFTLFKDQLLYYFISSVIPYHVLVEKACCNAFMKFKPKIALTFLELFPYSRAFYAGAKKGCPETRLATMQHASYSRGKTFIRYDPEIEFYGKPDGCPIPKPDYVFAMGELGKEIFHECGFHYQDIFLTGSARYEHVRSKLIEKSQIIQKSKLNVLMVTTLAIDIEMDMVEAVYFATKDLPRINLFLRNHPFARMDEHPLFPPLMDRITITRGTLDDDLQAADLLIFSCSTVAEEALIGGIPVWQWYSAGYNGSAFRDIKGIPTFCSVSDLRDSVKKFIDNHVPFIPNEKTRNNVVNRCFYKADGKSSERIASTILELLN